MLIISLFLSGFFLVLLGAILLKVSLKASKLSQEETYSSNVVFPGTYRSHGALRNEKGKTVNPDSRVSIARIAVLG